MRSLSKTALGLLFVLSLLAAFPSCARKASEEELVKETLAKAAQAAEEKDMAGVMRAISKKYADDSGNDYNAVKGIVFHEVMKPGRVSIFIRKNDVEVKEGTALAQVRAIITRGGAVEGIKDIVPENADGFLFSIVLKKEDGAWKAVSAKWESIGAAGLL